MKRLRCLIPSLPDLCSQLYDFLSLFGLEQTAATCLSSDMQHLAFLFALTHCKEIFMIFFSFVSLKQPEGAKHATENVDLEGRTY